MVPLDELLSLHGQLEGVGVEAKLRRSKAQLHLSEALPQQVLSEAVISDRKSPIILLLNSNNF
jgi:hypothetical protein